MTTTRQASCHCGQLKATCEGEPVRVSVCHCLACQQRTGSAFGVQARYPADRVTTTGLVSQYVRVGDTGNKVTFHFCPRCGSTVLWSLEALPGFVAVAVGAFADNSFPQPTVAVYEVRQHPWLELATIEEHYE